jgi:hypothetical protein
VISSDPLPFLSDFFLNSSAIPLLLNGQNQKI